MCILAPRPDVARDTEARAPALYPSSPGAPGRRVSRRPGPRRGRWGRRRLRSPVDVCSTLTCSHSSPAFAWRNQTRSPIRSSRPRPAAAGSAPRRRPPARSVAQPAGYTGTGSRSAPAPGRRPAAPSTVTTPGRRAAHDRRRRTARPAAARTRGSRRTASARTAPSPAATSVTASSAAVRSTLPVPPPLTNSSGTTGRHRGDDLRPAARAARGPHRPHRRHGAAPRCGRRGRRRPDARDLGLVGHHPDQPEAAAARRPRWARRGLLGLVHRRAPRPDVHPAARQPQRRVRLQAHPQLRRPPAEHASIRSSCSAESTISVTRARGCGSTGQLPQRRPVGRRVRDTTSSLAGPRRQPQRLGQRE